LEAALKTVGRFYYAGELEEAERGCREILRVHPNEPRALYRLGKVALAAGVPSMAMAFIAQAIARDPSDASFHRGLGDALRLMGKNERAEVSLRRALELAPDSPRVRESLSALLMQQGRLAAALEILETALSRWADDAHLHQSLGCLQIMMGRAPEAVASFRNAMKLAPDSPNPHGGVLFAQHYLPEGEPETLFADARAWGVRYATPLAQNAAPHGNDRNPERRLRIGYVSADFQQHPVGRVLQAVIPSHDPAQVEVYCYATRRCTDAFARRLSLAADHWRSLVHLGDEAAAELIRRDEIDILIDLSGHTDQNRLLVLARKPAPVQAVWLGYFDTTGMSSVDYIFADRSVCPAGEEALYVEKVLRLPDSFLCYSPMDPSPDVAPLPMLERGYPTFGSLNNLSKIGPDVIALWADILHAIPDGRMVLKYGGLGDAVVKNDFWRAFEQHGIPQERVKLLDVSPLGEHLAAYDEIDIALDSFPYNGGITTLDALWMGTPVVTLAGDRFVGRMGVSTLSTLGLDELIAKSREEYVEKAVALARHPRHLGQLRASLRERVVTSPLCDGAAFARALEGNYREMWRTWCTSPLIPERRPSRELLEAEQR
jgi:protein O-GlcNAc transferase